MTVEDISRNVEMCVCMWPSEREVESVGSSCTEMEVVTVALRSPTDQVDEGKNRGSPVRRTDSPSKKKGAAIIDLSFKKNTNHER